jgi:uncharacterized SAM-binding protein YcdF (DUF218 family)
MITLSKQPAGHVACGLFFVLMGLFSQLLLCAQSLGAPVERNKTGCRMLPLYLALKIIFVINSRIESKLLPM